jgi:hypothetical protein
MQVILFLLQLTTGAASSTIPENMVCYLFLQRKFKEFYSLKKVILRLCNLRFCNPACRNLSFPGTRNLEPGTLNLEPGTRNLESYFLFLLPLSTGILPSSIP